MEYVMVTAILYCLGSLMRYLTMKEKIKLVRELRLQQTSGKTSKAKQ